MKDTVRGDGFKEGGFAFVWIGNRRFSSEQIVAMLCERDVLRKALEQIADIAEGSTTANSLPHIAKIARAATKSTS
jgi:hypothetical protein